MTTQPHLNFAQESVYISEILTQCRHAVSAVLTFNSAIRQLTGEEQAELDAPTLRNEVFRNLHSFLTHSSNVSRIFWPDVPRRQKGEARQDYRARVAAMDRTKRGYQLRSLFKIANDSVLRRRTLRNLLEHFDERLDEWRQVPGPAKLDPTMEQSYVTDVIAPRQGIAFDPEVTMRWFDQHANEYWFRGEKFDLQALAKAIQHVRNIALQLDEDRRAAARSTP
jgi:hypothetical protein